MSDEIPMMTCDWCGKHFPADARACVEAGVDAFQEGGEEWKGEQYQPIDPASLSSMQRDAMKAELDLDDAQLDQLLLTGRVDGLGAIVCLDCQDAGLETEEVEP